MASFRYRTQIPADYIGAAINDGDADIVVFSKPWPEDVDLARYAKADGCKIVVDFCDPHFHLEHYREMLRLADVKVVASQWSRDHIIKDAFVIPDPYELPEIEPHADGERHVWFGHKANLKDLDLWWWIPNLKVVSGPFEEVPDGITFYSPENLIKALTDSNMALFPFRRGSEYKSSNRILNAIRMGLFPICGRYPSYEEFKDFCWVSDFHTGYKWAHHNRKNLNSLVCEAQDYIRDRYSPEAIGKQWKSLLESI